MNRDPLYVALICLLFNSFCILSASTHSPKYTFGIFPQRHSKLFLQFEPLSVVPVQSKTEAVSNTVAQYLLDLSQNNVDELALLSLDDEQFLAIATEKDLLQLNKLIEEKNIYNMEKGFFFFLHQNPWNKESKILEVFSPQIYYRYLLCEAPRLSNVDQYDMADSEQLKPITKTSSAFDFLNKVNSRTLDFQQYQDPRGNICIFPFKNKFLHWDPSISNLFDWDNHQKKAITITYEAVPEVLMFAISGGGFFLSKTIFRMASQTKHYAQASESFIKFLLLYKNKILPAEEKIKRLKQLAQLRKKNIILNKTSRKVRACKKYYDHSPKLKSTLNSLTGNVPHMIIGSYPALLFEGAIHQKIESTDLDLKKSYHHQRLSAEYWEVVKDYTNFDILRGTSEHFSKFTPANDQNIKNPYHLISVVNIPDQITFEDYLFHNINELLKSRGVVKVEKKTPVFSHYDSCEQKMIQEHVPFFDEHTQDWSLKYPEIQYHPYH